MDIDAKFMENFKRVFDSKHPLKKLKATELAKNGAEQQGGTAISLDPPDENFPNQISLIYQDDNTDLYDAMMNKGDLSRQRTFITVSGPNAPEKLFRFDGLIDKTDARLWFRDHLGFPSDAEQAVAVLEGEIIPPVESP